CFFFSSRRRHTRFSRDWSSDVCSSDLAAAQPYRAWLDENLVRLDVLPERVHVRHTHASVTRRQQIFGYTEEELRMILSPMAQTEIGTASCRESVLLRSVAGSLCYIRIN